MFPARVAGRWLVALTATLALGGLALLPVHATSSDTYETGVAQSHQLYRSGEPWIAVDPTHPSNMIYVATKFKLRKVTPSGPEVPNEATQFSEFAWGSGTMGCSLSFSADYGTTWTEVPFPIAPYPGCADPMAAAGPDGTLYVGMERFGDPVQDNLPVSVTDASIGVARSTDDGRTWSVAAGTGAATDGRPWMRVDQRTGYVWVNSGWDSPSCPRSAPCGRTLAYSKDKGQTWSQVNHPLTAHKTAPVPVPGAVYAPGSEPFPGNEFAVHDNILASTLPATAATATANQPAQPAQFCVLHPTPTDPTTGTYGCKGIPGTTGMAGPCMGGNPCISADPTKTGRFAVMLKSGDSFKVFVTENAGGTWLSPSTLVAPHSGDDSAMQTGFAVASDKPWFDYSLSPTGPSGLLGIMWKSATPNGKIDVHSAVSTDNGATFSQPKKVNSVSFSPEATTDGPGDDLSFLAFGASANGQPNTYISWGDTRTPPTHKVEGWFGRVPVATYSR